MLLNVIQYDHDIFKMEQTHCIISRCISYFSEKTQIVSPPSDDDVRYGESSVFTCGAVTDKEEAQRLKFEWLKDGVKIIPDNIKVNLFPKYIYIY